GFAGVGARVGPFLFQGAVEPLDLAVGLGPVGAGAFVRDLLAQGGGGGLGPVGGPVVGRHPLDGDPARGEVVSGTAPARGGGFRGLIGWGRAVGQPGGVIEGAVHAGGARPAALLAPVALGAAGGSVAAAVGDAPALRDIHMDKIP